METCRTTGVYDCKDDPLTIDEIEQVAIGI